ncbi:MAG: NUDIX domain-containing protein [Patescibacteria group bacterium]|nr:NUDIX domain-containing protein [Patescibacteria group bacterium]
MNQKETLVFDGREVFLEWTESNSIPNNIRISQVVGYCIDNAGKILIVKNKRGWGFPGGHPEIGEKPEDTLRREVAEEAYVTLKEPRLIGYMEVKDPQNESIEGTHYIQLRYLAKIETVNEFKKEFETSERDFVDVNSLSQYISWINFPTGEGQIETLVRYIAEK